MYDTQTWTLQIVLYKQKFFIRGFFISGVHCMYVRMYICIYYVCVHVYIRTYMIYDCLSLATYDLYITSSSTTSHRPHHFPTPPSVLQHQEDSGGSLRLLQRQ